MSVLTRIRTLFGRSSTMERVFTDIFRNRRWGNGVSVSGPGSDLVRTSELRKTLPALLRELGATSLLDAPCGDFYWMKELGAFVERYVGVDVVREIIDANRRAWPDRSFHLLDFTSQELPRTDFVLCRDGLVHLPDAAVFAALRRFKESGAQWLFATTFPDHDHNGDIQLGYWRPMNLQRPPFRFPPPLRLVNEGCPELRGEYRDKSLGLWRLADVPTGPSTMLSAKE